MENNKRTKNNRLQLLELYPALCVCVHFCVWIEDKDDVETKLKNLEGVFNSISMSKGIQIRITNEKGPVSHFEEDLVGDRGLEVVGRGRGGQGKNPGQAWSHWQ